MCLLQERLHRRQRRKAIMRINLIVNGQRLQVDCRAGETLLEVLRRHGFKSVKKACETGNCGACTVLLNGDPVASCLMLAAQADGCYVTTIEGLTGNEKIRLLQEAFVDHGAPQCGFCTPGMILTASSLLETNPSPTRTEVRKAIAGNICRCSGYVKVVDAIVDAARRIAQLGGEDHK